MFKINNKIGIILVNYNGISYNTECINSILESSYKNFMIVVVDNLSTDGSVDKLRKDFDDKITIIENEENLGFSEANNIGIQYALNNGCDYILLLNNDTIIEKDLIETMLKSSIEDDAVISPKIFYYDNRNIIWSAGSTFNWKKGLPSQCGLGEIDTGKYDKKKNVEFATGCCMLIPKKVINKVGYLSDEYFLYFEDTDYSTRIIRNNFKIVYEPKAVLYHKVSASTGGVESPNYIYYNTRNRLIFNNKFNKQNKASYVSYFYFTRIVKLIRWLIKGNKSNVSATIEAIKDYYNGHKGKKQFKLC